MLWKEVLCWKVVLFYSYFWIILKANPFIGGVLCHLCIHFHLLLDLHFMANHLYPEVITVEKLISCFKVTCEIPFHIVSLTHWEYHVFLQFVLQPHPGLYDLEGYGFFLN